VTLKPGLGVTQGFLLTFHSNHRLAPFPR